MAEEELEFRDLDGNPQALFSKEDAEKAIEKLDNLGSTDDLEIEVEGVAEEAAEEREIEEVIEKETKEEPEIKEEEEEELEIVEEGAEEGEEEGEEEEEGDEEGEGEEEDEEDEPDEDILEYSEKMQKRIMRERRLKNKIKGELSTANQKAENTDRHLRAAEERIRELEKSNIDSAKAAYESMARASEQDLEQATEKYSRAYDDGDTEEFVKAQLALNRAQAMHDKIVSEKEEYDNIKPAEATPPVQPPMTDEAVAWTHNNDSLLRNNKEVLAYVYKIDDGVIIPGDPNSSEYFDTMNKMIEAKFPNVKPEPSRIKKKVKTKVKTKVKKKVTKKKSKVAAVSTDGTVSGEVPKSKTKITITKAHKVNMERFGMDPANKEHLKAYAKEVRRSESQSN